MLNTLFDESLVCLFFLLAFEFERLALIDQPLALGVLGLNGAHVALALLVDEMGDERIDLSLCSRSNVGMQMTH